MVLLATSSLSFHKKWNDKKTMNPYAGCKYILREVEENHPGRASKIKDFATLR